MDGSRTIRVIKRDGSEEPFDRGKLAGAVRRAAGSHPDGPHWSAAMAVAVEVFIIRQERQSLPSSAVFEMILKVLRRMGWDKPADAMEAHRLARADGRRLLRVRHDEQRVTMWDKTWAGRLACRTWGVSRTTGRILAGMIEHELIAGGPREIPRDEVQRRINEKVAAYGLADAVPVELPASGG